MDENIKMGDVVVYKDQSKNLRNGCIMGGIVKAIGGTFILLYRPERGMMSARLEEVRKLNPDDLEESGIEVI